MMTAYFRLFALTLGLSLNLPQLEAAAPPRLDRYDDPLPPDALARIGTGRFRHYAKVSSLAYSPDGKLIAGGDSSESFGESSIVIWDAATGRRLHRLEGHGHVVRDLAFAPDNRRLAVACGDGSLRIWDVKAEKEIARLKTGEGFDFVVFTGDGRSVVAADRDGVGLWDATTGRRLARFAGLGGAYCRVALSPDDKMIAAWDRNGKSLLWERATGKELRRFRMVNRYVRFVAFSLDGKRLVYGGDETICLLDVETGKEVQRIKSPDYCLCSHPFLSACRVLVTYNNDAIRFWDAATGKEIRRIEGRRGYVEALALSPDGKRLVTGFEGEAFIRHWDTATAKEIPHPEGHELGVVSMSFAPDGKSVATASNEPICRLWDAASGKLIGTFSMEGGAIGHLAFSPDGKTLAGSIPTEFGGSTYPVSLWDVKTRRLLCVLGEKGQGSKSVAFSDDGTMLAANLSDASVVLWDLATRKPCFHPFKGERNPLRSSFVQYSDFVFAPDGKSLAAACFLNVRAHLVLWDAFRGKRRFAVMTRSGEIASYPETTADFSRDGHRIATVRDNQVRVREAVSGAIVRTFEGHGDIVYCAAFSPDGRLLASAGRDRTIRVWDLATGRQRQIFRGHQDAISCLAFASDGRRLASGSDDMTALIWILKDSDPVQMPRPLVSAKEVESLWSKLGGTDAATAEKAIWDLALAGDAAVAFLKQRIGPVQSVARERIAALIADLDSERFEIREKAHAELIHLGESAIALLRRTREQGRTSLELRRRIDYILAELDERERTPEEVRMLRVVDVLEHSESASAWPMLERLASGVAESRLTSAAKAALKRLDRRSARKGKVP